MSIPGSILAEEVAMADQTGGAGRPLRDELLRQAEALREAAERATRASKEDLLQQAEILREAANAAAWSTVDDLLRQAEAVLFTGRRRPGEGREAAKRRTREEILRAAAEVFTRKGFHGASVDDVAAAAGFTKGAVYSNFSSKDELFLALLDDRWGREAELWVRTFTEAPSPAAAWEAIARYHADDAAEQHDWDLLSVEFHLYAMRVPAARKRIRDRLRQLRDGVAELLDEHYERTHATPPVPTPHLVLGLMAIQTGLGFHLMLDPDAVEDPEGFATALAARLFEVDAGGDAHGRGRSPTSRG
jgi:AcrR family transcriptional regulator